MTSLLTTHVDREVLFHSVRDSIFHGKLSQLQVDGINIIVSKAEEVQLPDKRWLAYMLATAYHETGHTMQPVAEYGKGFGRDYGRKLKRGGGPGRRIPYEQPDKIYYGRGYVQLTWFENYEQMGKLLKHDLLNHPELAMQPDIAAEIMFEGMTNGFSRRGDFTGVSLEKYFNDKTEDWVNARRIINGLDKADLIAEYGRKFYAGLS